jgi:hypothetical protein
MQTRADVVDRRDWSWFWMTLILFALGQSGAFAQPSCCSGSGCCGGPPEQACTLTYGARGVVRDSVTGAPIPNASISVLNAGGASGPDGSFDVSGARAETCHVDYFYQLLVQAAGYNPYGLTLYTSAMYPTLTIELDPEDTTSHVTVSGLVTEFPPCNGAMRGVTVALEPIGYQTQTSVADGRFELGNVPPGDYTVRVLNRCNPFGCWEAETIRVDAEDVDLTICMTAIDPGATPTPTPTVYPGPSITATVCPEKTPCVLGEEPLPCGDRCGLGCGCQACTPCPPGTVPDPRPNVCACAPDPNITPPPTPTPGNCFFPTPPLCPVGQTAQCVTEDGCDSDCSCVPCEPCPPGLSYSGEPNSCLCLDPRTVTATPTPDTRTSTPTPSPDSGETPIVCPTRTPLACPTGENTVCDTSVDPCGLCQCRAVPQGPEDDVSLGASSSDGCAIAPSSDAGGSLWSWSLLLIAMLGRRREIGRR